MSAKKFFGFGGLVASIVLLGFGVAAIVIGIQGRNEVRDTLRQEQIYAPEDSTIPGQLVDTGAKAKAQADIVRKHQLAATNGLTYSQMGRFAVESGDPAGTNDADLAAKDANGKPIANAARNQWVTATALTTSLNTAFFAEQVGLFAIVVGIALVLSGAGFGVLTLAALYNVSFIRKEEKGESKAEGTGTGRLATTA